MTGEPTGSIITRQGKILLAKAMKGEELIFTKMAVGDGYCDSITEEQAALINEKMTADIQSSAVNDDGTVSITGVITNRDLQEGFSIREIGVYARLNNEEVLYCYANQGEECDYIVAGTGAVIVQEEIEILTIIDDLEGFKIAVNPKGLVTQEAFLSFAQSVADIFAVMHQRSLSGIHDDFPVQYNKYIQRQISSKVLGELVSPPQKSNEVVYTNDSFPAVTNVQQGLDMALQIPKEIAWSTQ